ncbi:Rieske (2Fe-2S) protein [Mesobacterium pallidum]|uniref:Rieske (2Fe-2S) protein n=1 Tax=Mesobacterium pallidum TaxID=2872037 RepID=UPI001EE321D9|nr:Rieske (2Fe-2S) protein [Mesobacterium pallidum]
MTDWIPVSTATGLRRGGVMRSFVCGQELAIWHSAGGAVHAWDNRCPHRGMRLSHGFVRGEQLACLYHGWHYGADGACTAIPAHPDLVPPASICVPTSPCIEAGGFVWVGGDPAHPPAEIPRLGLRSLHVEVPLATLRAHLGGTPDADGLVPFGIAAAALQAWDDRTTVLHLATPPKTSTTDRIALSRAAEALRREVEEWQTA